MVIIIIQTWNKVKFFPPDPKKLSFPSIDISSSVSTQSEAKQTNN